ncbi:endolytic transglycosylase MltG [Rathayibacter soli]|uniref:endolytic transglycosylase MltG n=1 Tax=Rathayibacter soli TaxID=3144168 RepID=UPI0027E5974D|nr:endolytic transglycosylase MltG [Glaciibacter superstes]
MTPSHSSDEAVDAVKPRATDPAADASGNPAGEPDLLGTLLGTGPQFDSSDTVPQPTTRREARDAAARRAHQATLGWSHEDYPNQQKPVKPKKRRRWLTVTIVIVVILGLFGGAGAYVWFTFQPEVLKVLNITEPNDYTGQGTGSVTISIKDGDMGSNVATTLYKAGVVKTADAFYSLLLKTKPDPVFQPGVYALKKQMSAKAALAALQDPKNKLQRTVAIPEGTTEADILASVAKATSIPLTDLQSAAANPAAFGLPSQAKSLEGFLFPATYTFDPGITANDVLKTMVDRSFTALDADGVPAADRWKTVVLASIVQKEAGPKAGDAAKVARVFQNRLDQGMLLQSDATVAYGAGVQRVFTTDAERADAANLYNTYVHQGLPIGPISNPGDVSIKAALNPTPGPWLYFVAVNLQTGDTVFSTTLAEQEAAVAQLQKWCNESAANDAYCK